MDSRPIPIVSSVASGFSRIVPQRFNNRQFRENLGCGEISSLQCRNQTSSKSNADIVHNFAKFRSNSAFESTSMPDFRIETLDHHNRAFAREDRFQDRDSPSILLKRQSKINCLVSDALEAENSGSFTIKYREEIGITNFSREEMAKTKITYYSACELEKVMNLRQPTPAAAKPTQKSDSVKSIVNYKWPLDIEIYDCEE